MALVDLSHAIEDGLVTYPGLPPPHVCDYLTREASRARYADGTTFHIGKIELVGNTGTYVDAPFHRYDGGADLADLPLDRLADLDAIVVRSDERAIGADAFAGLPLAGRAIVVHTGWSRHFGTPAYGIGAPFLTRGAADALVAGGAAFVAIDSVNIDSLDDLARPVHTRLLGAGIPIGEHFTNLGALPARGARLHAVPAKVRAMGTFPVRAYAIL
jgi:kynurenine formamidase